LSIVDPANGRQMPATTQPSERTTSSSSAAAPDAQQPAKLADAPDVERQTLGRMLHDSSWARRSIAAMRLERYGCAESREALARMLQDRAWQARAFAIRTLARRGVPAEPGWFANESEPRVMRTVLRCRYDIPADRVARGVRVLARSENLDDKMLAAEIAAASAAEDLRQDGQTALKQVILRMSRVEAGALSPRLSALTGAARLYRPYDWQRWLMKSGRNITLRPAMILDQGPNGVQAAEPSRLAQLQPDEFASLEAYMSKLGERHVDLAICLDCTGSMSGEIAAAQGGIDEMMMFIGDIVSNLRVGLVAYRDRNDEFETRLFDFSNSMPQVRQNLWQLSADGGGDEPEAVYQAMNAAVRQLRWLPESTRVLVVVGDAPPHVGFGALCVRLAEQGRQRAQLTTHTIQAKGKAVKHFTEIAQAGGGRCVSVKDVDSLVAEITGLTLADRFQDELREFFQVYLELCR
jgi:Mg-chelatase subunit ChlD